MIDVLIADNQPLTFDGLIALFSTTPDIRVTGTASSYAELEQKIVDLKPVVVIIDHQYNEQFSIANIKKLNTKFDFARVLIISNRQQREEILELKSNGIKNYLFKECGRDEIIKAVYATAKSEQFFCKSTFKILFEDEETLKKVENISHLSAREIEIVHLVAEGLTNKEIADKLFLSFHTVKTHRKNIIKKLGFSFKNATELVLFTS